MYNSQRLTVLRRGILHILGSDDIAIIIAQLLSLGVTITTILQVVLGGLSKHIECITPAEASFAFKVQRSNLRF